MFQAKADYLARLSGISQDASTTTTTTKARDRRALKSIQFGGSLCFGSKENVIKAFKSYGKIINHKAIS